MSKVNCFGGSLAKGLVTNISPFSVHSTILTCPSPVSLLLIGLLLIATLTASFF